MSEASGSVRRALVGIVLFMMGAIGLVMTLCGLSFTTLAISQPKSMELLVFSVPSAAAGGLLLWLVVRTVRRTRRVPETTSTDTAPR